MPLLLAFLQGHLVEGVFLQLRITPRQEYILRIQETIFQQSGYSVAWDAASEEYYLTKRLPGGPPIYGGEVVTALPPSPTYTTMPPGVAFIRKEVEALETFFPQVTSVVIGHTIKRI